MGLLVMSYGTPDDPDEIGAYYTHVRGGRAPSPEALADLRRRYMAIGGVSPLAERTRAQADGIATALERLQPGRWKTFVGSKHAWPFIEDGVSAMTAAGIRHGVGLVLAPHYSALSIGTYVDRVRDAAAQADVTLSVIESWHLLPALLDLLAERLTAALQSLPADLLDDTEVLVTAHSLPARVAEMGDPYPAQLAETAEAITRAAGVKRWRVAWQSAGRTPEPWLGPDVGEVIRDLAARGTRAVVVCPAGFTSDHLEVLYDIDIEALAVAEAAGLVLVRTESLNDDPRLMDALAELVVSSEPR
jgi:ferrochelatase